MFCLRSWLPLLFIPTNASPFFLISFVALTYILHRPCIYCSALLVILFASTCTWSDRCFFNLRSNWLAPRYTSPYDTQQPDTAPANESLASYVVETVNSTAQALFSAAVDETQRILFADNESCPTSAAGVGAAMGELGGEHLTVFGLEWLRSLVGRREWTLPCVDVKVRL